MSSGGLRCSKCSSSASPGGSSCVAHTSTSMLLAQSRSPAVARDGAMSLTRPASRFARSRRSRSFGSAEPGVTCASFWISVARVGDYLGLLRELAALNPPVHVFGGIAEEALLDDALGPSHGDLDVVIPRCELGRRVGQLAELGFRDFAVYYEPRPGRPSVFGSSNGDLALELSLVDYDASGGPYFAVRTEKGVFAIFVPRDMFAWPPIAIEGVAIRTVSPLALVQIRAGLTATGAFGPPRPGKDAPLQARLIKAFFPDAEEASLQPWIAPIADG